MSRIGCINFASLLLVAVGTISWNAPASAQAVPVWVVQGYHGCSAPHLAAVKDCLVADARTFGHLQQCGGSGTIAAGPVEFNTNQWWARIDVTNNATDMPHNGVPDCLGPPHGVSREVVLSEVCPLGTEFDPVASCGPPQRSGANGCLSKGNPCDVLVGDKREVEVDYVGANGLGFKRTYSNAVYRDWAFNYRPLGVRWFGQYLQYLSAPGGLSGSLLYAIRPDGDVVVFSSSLPGSTATTYSTEGEFKDRLVPALDGSGAFVGWRYITAEDDQELYDTNGRLLSIRTRAGMTHTLAYASNRLASVTDDFGHQLTFQWDTAAGRISSITLPGTGGQLLFTYDSNRLTQVTYPDTRTRQYLYELNSTPLRYSLLTGLKDETGTRYATWGYGVGDVVTSSTHAGGVDSYSVTYNTDGTRVVVDPLGVSRTYSTELIGGQRRYTGSNLHCEGCGEHASATFDAFGNFASKVDFNGVETRYTHDTARTLETSRTEAYGTPRARTINTTWHSTFRLPTQIDEPGKRTTFTHDSNGNVLSKTVLDTSTIESRTWTYTYNSFGQVLTANGPRTDVSDVTTYTYYSCTTGYECGQLHTVTNAAGHVTTYNSYNVHGQPLTITDPNWLVTTLTYDARQRLTSRTIGSEQTTFTYWPTGLLKKATLPDSSFLEYTYDAAHRLIEIEDAQGNRILYTLDAMGNRTAENLYDPSSALTQTRTRVFNTLNQLWKDVGAAGTGAVTTTFGYDNNGNQTGISAPLSRNTAQGYDELNRLTQITDPLSGVTQYGYNVLDQLISVTDPRSNATTYAYNALGDLTQQVSPDTGTTTNTYDSAGNLQLSTDARSKTATYAYDALNRVTGVTYADQSISYTYDSGTNQKGRLTQISDASGSTQWTYDSHGRVLSRQQNMGVSKTLSYAYDTSGRPQILTLPSGNTITYAYTNGQISGLTLNGSTTILNDVLYEPFGPTRGWTWGNSTLAIREYDSDGRVTTIDSAGLKNYAYDDASRIVGIADADTPALSAEYEYDAADRLFDAPSADSVGISLNATTVASGATLEVSVSNLPQTPGYWLALSSVETSATTYYALTAIPASSSTYTWNVAVPSFAGTYEIRVFTGGFQYRVGTSAPFAVTAPPAPSQPTLKLNVSRTPASASVTVRLAGGPGAPLDWLGLAQVGAADTAWLQWTYVGSGVTSRDWTVTMPATEGSYEFRLFANSSFTRLATSSPIVLTDDPPVTGGSPPASGLYDLNGNRLAYDSSAYAISSTSNRLLSVSGAINRTYSYDNAGNPTSDGTATFTYNDAGRMVSATKASVTTTYALNALGQRVKKTNSGASTYFVYDEAGHLVGEYNTSGNLIQETVWFGDTPVATLRPNGGGVNLFYVHTDHLNTPRRVSRPSDNAVIWRWDSDPFGTTTANQDPDGDSNPFAYGLRFPGQYFDTETGLHYNYMRDGYEPAIGRYTQSDPIGLAGGMNSYTYVSGNPINLVDPLGLAECLYSISRHTLECKSSNPRPKGRRPSVSISGDGVFSGLGQCRNNPSNECQDSRDEGPVPEGPYRLNRHEGRAGFWRLESIPPVRGWQFALGLKRNGFMLHPGSISLGCITVDKNNEELMQGYALINSLLQSQDGRNTLEVIP